jgi:3-deoxy-D-manno-octulosonic-acid transferase
MAKEIGNMKKIIWKSVYRFIISPLLIISFHFLAIFSKKIRSALFPRYSTLKFLKNWLKNHPSNNRRVIFHAASLGEFEHIKPLLIGFKSRFHTVNIVTFFSPSGYNNSANFQGLDYRMYIPFDIPILWRLLYYHIKPSLLIISKHDIWPEQIWSAKKMNIPVILLNASLAQESSRTKIIVRHFLAHVYNDLDKIFAISEEDAVRFKYYCPRSKIKAIGDTKYDQVLFRRKFAQGKKYLNRKWVNSNPIFIAGSIWPEDEVQLFPAIKRLLKKYKFNIILAPHEPDQGAIATIENEFQPWGVILFSDRENLKDERIIIIDSVGYLADIYQYGSFAYLGGSFKQGIHNVMEAAIYGIPVLYGPVHKNSYEALKLARDNGGIVVKDFKDIDYWIKKFLDNKQKCIDLGKKAEQYAMKNTGITAKILSECHKYIKGE